MESYLPNIIKIFQNNMIFGIVLLLGILIVSVAIFKSINNKTKLSWDTRILLGLVAASGFGVLLVAKHYHFNHYLIPTLLLTGVSSFFVLKILLKANFNSKIKKTILPILVIGLLIFISWQQPSKMKYASYGYRITNEEIDSTNLMLEQDFADYARIYYYPFSFYKYSALNFGDVYTKRQMLPYLKKLYPNTYFYDFYWNKMQYWNADITLSDILKFSNKKVLMLGGPRKKEDADKLIHMGIQLKEVYRGRIQAIYEIDTSYFAPLIANQGVIEEVICDMEKLTSDYKSFVGSNNIKFGESWCRSNKEAHSGLYSVKMDNKTEFAMEYILDSVKQGEKYEIEVWRKSDNYSGRLVVSASNANLFYNAQNDFISSENGWDLIQIKFTVTQKQNGEKLKIYLWNKDKQLGYFDDLTIRKLQ